MYLPPRERAVIKKEIHSAHPWPLSSHGGESSPPKVSPCTRGDFRGVFNSLAPIGEEGARRAGEGVVRNFFTPSGAEGEGERTHSNPPAGPGWSAAMGGSQRKTEAQLRQRYCPHFHQVRVRQLQLPRVNSGSGRLQAFSVWVRAGP